MANNTNHHFGLREHLWKVELAHCLFSGAIVFLVFYVIAGVLMPSAQVDVGWEGLLYSILAAHAFVLSLVFFALTFLKHLRLSGTVGMISCIIAGVAVCGLDAIVLSAASREVLPLDMILSFSVLGAAFGWIYRLCQNAHFNPAVSEAE